MARYRMSDGMIVDTEKSTMHWEEERDFDGSNHIGRSSGSQWSYQTLYRSRKGRYYMVVSTAFNGVHEHAEWVSNEEAVRFLVLNDYDLPDDLSDLYTEVLE